MTEQVKNPVGRPTKYKPEFCDIIINVGEDGGWLCEMAEACDVHRSTMDEWAANFPEFSDALSRAKQKALAWFERVGRTGLFADKFQASLWSKQMAARNPSEYSEKARVDHTSSDGSMTPKDTVTVIERIVAAPSKSNDTPADNS